MSKRVLRVDNDFPISLLSTDMGPFRPSMKEDKFRIKFFPDDCSNLKLSGYRMISTSGFYSLPCLERERERQENCLFHFNQSSLIKQNISPQLNRLSESESNEIPIIVEDHYKHLMENTTKNQCPLCKAKGLDGKKMGKFSLNVRYQLHHFHCPFLLL